MEYLDIRDEKGNLVGQRKAREEVHRDGDLHGTSHVWIVNPIAGQDRENVQAEKFRILLQKRSRNKDAYPGCYDISSAGHIPAGDDYLSSAIRELYEELGIEASPEDLVPLGTFTYEFKEIFHGKFFHNHEISTVYIYEKPVDETKLKLQEEEVEAVCWMGLEECLEKVQKKDPQFCIIEEELRMLQDYLY